MEGKICIRNARKRLAPQYAVTALALGVIDEGDFTIDHPCGCERCTKPVRRFGRIRDREMIADLMGDIEMDMAVESDSVIIFTGPDCQRCHAAKPYIPNGWFTASVDKFYALKWMAWWDLAREQLPVIRYPNGEFLSGGQVLGVLGVTEKQCDGGSCEI